jgi:hypothetical protein
VLPQYEVANYLSGPHSDALRIFPSKGNAITIPLPFRVRKATFGPDGKSGKLGSFCMKTRRLPATMAFVGLTVSSTGQIKVLPQYLSRITAIRLAPHDLSRNHSSDRGLAVRLF